MAKLLVTVTFFLFILALSHARTQLDLPVNDVRENDLSTDLQESEPKTTTTTTRTIFLPSEKPEPESERETAVDIEPEKTESGTQESETNDVVPLAVINFRPISRQFPRRPSLTFRHRRPCHQHRFGKPWGPIRFQPREISYGNDMIMSSAKDKEEVREIPARWVKFHHSDTTGPRFPNWRDDGEARTEDFKRLRHNHHHHHHHHHGHMDGEEGDEREGQEHERGFLMKIRKFLNHF